MFFDPILDFFRGKAITIPTMDGALKPNTALDQATLVAAAEAPDNLAMLDGALVYSSGKGIWRIEPNEQVMSFAADISAVASEGKNFAVALDDGSIILDGKPIAHFKCPTALAFHDGALLVCNGSKDFRPSEWVIDLMHRNATGSVWRFDLNGGGQRELASGLGFASGIVVDRLRDRLVISESWRHRLLAIPSKGGSPSEVIARLPAYPSRMCRAGNGYLLCLFAPLNRLVEFVLQEPDYRADMMREIESRFWIAPTLTPAASFLEPLQNGGVRSMGIHKPWSPSRSYGLIALLDENFQPVTSYHSRANGRFHGMTSAILANDEIYATSKGGHHVIRFPLAEAKQ